MADQRDRDNKGKTEKEKRKVMRILGARVAVALLVYQIGAGGCREHGDARARCGTRADGWILDVKM